MFYVVANLELDLGKLKVGLAIIFVLIGIDVLIHPAFEQHKPTWFLPLVSFAAVALPLALSVRGTRAGPPAGFGDGLGVDGQAVTADEGGVASPRRRSRG